jgi:hypothetical protein
MRRFLASRRLLVVMALTALVMALLPGVGALAAQSAVSGAQKAASAQPDLVTNTPAGCNTKQPAGYAQCFSIVRTPSSKKITADQAGPPPGALGPRQIQSAYDLPSATAGGGQTVAIVDAYGDPNAESDLAAFRSHYGLPPCTTANGCFRKVDQTGGTSYPADDYGWGLETSLDLDTVSSACPNCNILLVEANTDLTTDLGAAVDEAVALGAKFVSNSYGGGEEPSELSSDPDYDHPGVAITASAGDDGYGVSYPAASPYVTAVGGTTLTQDSSVPRGWDETVWGSSAGGEGTGSGCSAYEPQPSFQQGVADLDGVCQNRAVADVAADANPASGLAVYDSLGYGGWLQVGGTSLASPLIAATYALAGTPAAGTYPDSYPYHDASQSSDLFDITSGANGSCGNILCTAGPGWDGPTGLGTPHGVLAFAGGPEGQISGEVTNTATGDPVAGATVTANPGDYVTRTDASGDYELSPAAGASYDLTTAGYGYKSTSRSGVAVTAGHTTTENFGLTAAPSGTLSGVVTDGSGQGWPLHAQISIPGYPAGSVWTSPYTGAFRVTLPQGSYLLSVSTDYPGYLSKQVPVTVGPGTTTEHVSLDADLATCSAPGYGPDALTQDFSGWSGGTARDGWSVSGRPGGWRFGQPGSLTPPPGGDDSFALADSSSSRGRVHTTLTSPAADLSGQSAPELTFDSAYYTAAGQDATVQVSTNGGRTWSTVWQTTADAVGAETIPLPSAADQKDVRARFSYSGHDGWYWAVDNVLLGTPGCVAQRGGLVAGVVTDRSTGSTVNGAQATSPVIEQPEGWPAGVSLATADPALPGGFYWLFEPATGSQRFTVTDSGYTSATAAVTVTGSHVTRQDWSLSPVAGASAATAAGGANAITTAATGPAGADSPSAAISSGAAAATAAAANSPSGGTVAVPSLNGKSDTVTLPTGDQLTLTSAGSGRYSISSGRQARRPNGTTPPLVVTGNSGPGEPGTVYAEPADAEQLIAAGHLDRGLFSVTWLATHESQNGTGTVPVIVQYSSRAALASAATPPGATRAAAPSSVPDAATYEVSLAHAAAFWAALTGATATTPSWPAAAPQLADGIIRAWLAGDAPPVPAGTAAAADAGLPDYTVTETIEAPSDAQVMAGGDYAGVDVARETLYAGASPALVGVTGPDAGQYIQPTGESCAAMSARLRACTAISVTYTVPAGVYSTQGPITTFMLDDQYQWIDPTVPQFSVTGDTSLTVNLNDARKFNVTTPKPTSPEAAYSMLMDYRSVPGGGTVYTAFYNASPDRSYWALPSKAVTIGTFHLSVGWSLEDPVVSMTVTTPGRLALDPWYQSLTNDTVDNEGGAVQFTGTHRLQLVNVGFGSAQDFAGKDVRGKLVLMRPNYVGDDDPKYGCTGGNFGYFYVQLKNALQAGAAGVIYDPTGTGTGAQSGLDCPLPLQTNLGPADGTAPQIPAVTIPSSQATALRALLAKGPVWITVSSAQPSTYAYYLRLYEEGGVPSSLNYKLTSQDLATFDDQLHSSQPGAADLSVGVWAPDELFTIAPDAPLPAQASRVDYIGPVSPGLIYDRIMTETSTYLDQGTQTGTGLLTTALDQRGISAVDDWAEPPLVPGPTLPTLEDGQPLSLHYGGHPLCSACRQADMFFPVSDAVSGAFPQESIADDGLSPASVQLYSGGTELQPTPFLGAIDAYTLPTARTSYRMVMESASQTGGSGNTQTTWDFTSAAPTANQVPPGYLCIGNQLGISSGPCQPAPLVFLKYDAGLSLSDAVTPGMHQLQVTAYHQATNAPPVTSLRVWTSSDGGTTWQPATVTRGHDGQYTVSYDAVAPSSAGGTVSLKVQATDAAGNDVTQVIDNAWTVRS